MRTVDAALTAALAAGNPTPYLKAYVGYTNGTVKNSHINVVKYTLTGTSLEFVIPHDSNFASDQESIWLERGVTIAGTTYSVTTGRFFIAEEEYLPGGFTRYKGFLFPHKYYSDTGDATYETVIDAFCTEWGKTASFKDEAEAWLDYAFLPTGQVIIVNNAMRFLNMLQQKRLIQCCDNGAEDVRFYSADVLGTADVTITIKDEFSLSTTKTRRRQYIWRDEAQTVHTDGTATDPLHNLGYLESTDDPPARNTQTFQAAAYVRPDLRIQDGDVVTFSFDGGTKTATVFAQVTEIFDANSTRLPKWRMLVEANPIYHATEGGAMPSTIERVSNYTPLNTSTFDNILGTDDNNLQAAMETLDEHEHVVDAAHCYNSTAISINNATITAMTLDTETFDSNGLHSTSTNTSRLTCQSAGKYAIGAINEFAAHATGRRFTGIYKNGSIIQNTKIQAVTDAGATTVVECFTIASLAVGDYIENHAFQASGGSLNVTPTLFMYKFSD